MTSSHLPEGYEICPHCEGVKTVLSEHRYKISCRLCMGTGMIDWLTKLIHRPQSSREHPMRTFEQNEKIRKFRKFRERMRERIKNDKFKSKRRRIW
jgi:hypothetical protein